LEQNKIGILVPAFNEANNLKYLIPKLKKLGDLLIVNDGSTDETQILLKSNYCNYISIKRNSGYENTVITGLKYFKKKNVDYVITFDADRQHKINEIKKIKKMISYSNIDLYIFNRKKKNRFSEYILDFIFQKKYNIKDPLSGLKVFSQNSLQEINLNNIKKKFLVDLSYVYFIKKFKIRNIEISTNKRKGKPKVGSALKVNFKILLISIHFLFKSYIH
jgi:glycosyltransferase involved in cell wall biosynthesis